MNGLLMNGSGSKTREQERRSAARIPWDSSVTYMLKADGGQCSAQLVDLSNKGCGFNADREFSPGTLLTLQQPPDRGGELILNVRHAERVAGLVWHLGCAVVGKKPEGY